MHFYKTTLQCEIMRIAVIGAGAAGLASVRHAVEAGFVCEVFEQSEQIGGTWNYTESVGVDENGVPIHTAMYEGLR